MDNLNNYLNWPMKYNGKEYPARTFTMASKDTGEVTYTIADESLFNEISKDDKYLETGTPEWNIDDQIYFYVETGQLNLSANEICKNHLDVEFEFISEHKT